MSAESAVLFDFFFFSSRRRHTRSKRDWSSDVCSSDLAEDEVGTPVPVQVGDGDAVPPAFRSRKPGLGGPVHQTAIFLMEYADRHPFPDDDQIELPVVVVIHPGAGGHHPDLREPRSLLERDVAEVPGAVVLQEIAEGREAVVARHDPPPDEQIEMPVAVPVPRHDAGATLRKAREGQRVPVEMAAAVVQVEAVLEGGVVLLELVAAAHDVEIRTRSEEAHV